MNDLVQEVESWILYRTIFNKLNRLAEDDLKQKDITPSQFAILSLLACHRSLTMGEISKRISCVNSNITSVIGRMIDKEIVKKETDKQDRRIVKVGLTEKGHEIYQSIAPEHHSFFSSVFDCLEENEFVELNNLLAKINKNLKCTSTEECDT